MQTLLLPTRVDSEADRGRDDGLAGDGLPTLTVPVRVRGGDNTVRNIYVRFVRGQLNAAG